ncbi:nuclear transport factor 2 family protein [Undibacterium sp. TJN19]|uniref:nuclear transport factor 2 family protein n=1 Tax=Undibacterium sp. TJN19 TaxID=3413055 RepID=UPI003BF42BA7
MNAIEHNLDIVDRHIQGEARDVDSILDLYTDDIVLEVPGRGLRFVGREAVKANYLAMWPAMAEVEIIPLDRFATASRVVDDMIVRMRLVGPGMTNAPLPIGSRVEIRLIHHFSIKNGLIAREQVFEIWRNLDETLSSQAISTDDISGATA